MPLICLFIADSGLWLGSWSLQPDWHCNSPSGKTPCWDFVAMPSENGQVFHLFRLQSSVFSTTTKKVSDPVKRFKYLYLCIFCLLSNHSSFLSCFRRSKIQTHEKIKQKYTLLFPSEGYALSPTWGISCHGLSPANARKPFAWLHRRDVR